MLVKAFVMAHKLAMLCQEHLKGRHSYPVAAVPPAVQKGFLSFLSAFLGHFRSSKFTHLYLKCYKLCRCTTSAAIESS